jgi:hypothetical protein
MGGTTNRRRRDDRRAELHRFSHWIETEYDVTLDWHYTPRGMLGQNARVCATAIAVSGELWGMPATHWEVSGEIVTDTRGVKELQAHMELLSRLMMDLQIGRMYGVGECEYALSPPLDG